MCIYVLTLSSLISGPAGQGRRTPQRVNVDAPHVGAVELENLRVLTNEDAYMHIYVYIYIYIYIYICMHI